MRLKTKILMVAIPTVSAMAVGAILVARHKRKKRRHAHDFLPKEARDALVELLDLKGEDFVPDGLGTSIYQRKLETMSDRQLIGAHLAIKVAEILRERGLDLANLSRDDVIHEVRELRKSAKGKDTRQDLIDRLGSLGSDVARGMLKDGLTVAAAAL
jgi:hypothetical protein